MDPREEIKEKIDIVELLGEYLQVKPSGTHSFKALCPFHSEKTPSMHISSDKGVWHCFGCSEGGDCFSFVMKMEGMEFPEALMYLGKKVGVEVKRFSSKESNERQRLIAITELAAKYYRKVLTDSPAAKAARDYLERRGFPIELQEKFGIGFAPDTWDALAKFLAKKGYRDTEGERAGLLLRKRSGSGVIDRFRNRIMIPLRDRHGSTVGFTGRIMPGADEKAGAKYMNTPETPIYHKSQLLYGLDLAKQAIKQKGQVIVVEGNLDVVASHKAGVENVVASSGTALGEDQLNLLKRYTTKLVFSFDSDAAGFAAAQKGIRLARHLEFDVRVAIIPPEAGKDPDEVVQKNPELWQKATENTLPIMKYFIDRAIYGKDLKKVEDKREVGRFLLTELAVIDDVVEREHWLQVISDLLKTNIDALRSAITQKQIKKEATKTSATTHQKPAPRSISKEERAGALLIGLMVQQDDVREGTVKTLKSSVLPTNELKNLYKELHLTYDQGHSGTAQKSFFSQFRDRLELSKQESLIPLLDKVSLEAEDFVATTTATKVLDQSHKLLQMLIDSGISQRRKAIEAELRQAERADDKETIDRLLNEFKDLQ